MRRQPRGRWTKESHHEQPVSASLRSRSLDLAQEVLRIEANALARLAERFDPTSFGQALDILLA